MFQSELASLALNRAMALEREGLAELSANLLDAAVRSELCFLATSKAGAVSDSPSGHTPSEQYAMELVSFVQR